MNSKNKSIATKKETELQRLKKLAGTTYGKFYQVIKGVQVISAYFESKPPLSYYSKYNNIEVLTVEYKNGKFSFPITNITGNIDTDIQIKNIFCNLLNIDLNDKLAA